MSICRLYVFVYILIRKKPIRISINKHQNKQQNHFAFEISKPRNRSISNNSSSNKRTKKSYLFWNALRFMWSLDRYQLNHRVNHFTKNYLDRDYYSYFKGLLWNNQTRSFVGRKIDLKTLVPTQRFPWTVSHSSASWVDSFRKPKTRQGLVVSSRTSGTTTPYQS